MDEPEISSEKVELKRDEHGRLLPGQPSLNPAGRPVGSVSIKEKVRQYLVNNPEKLEEFVKYFAEESRELAWQMLEGKPEQKVDGDMTFKTYEIIRGNEDIDRSLQGPSTPMAQGSAEGLEKNTV